MSNRALVTGSETRPVLANAQMLGGLSLNPVGNFVSLAVSGSDNDGKSVSFASKSDVLLSGSFTGVSGSIIQALNYLQAVASAGSGDVSAGTGADNQLTYWSDFSAKTIASDADLRFDGAAFGFGGTNGTTFDVNATALTLDGTSASNLTATGANLTVSTATSGELIINSAGTLDIDGEAVEVDASAGLSLDGQGAASNLTSTGQDLTISTATSGELIVNAVATLDIDGVAVEVDASGGLSLDGTGAASNLTSTGQNLTVSTATSGELIINAVDVLDIDSGGAMQITSAAGVDLSGVAVNVTGSGALVLGGTTSAGLESVQGSIAVGSSIKDGQSIVLGRSAAASVQIAHAADAANESIMVTNTDGTGQSAVLVSAEAGGIAAMVKNATTHAFQVSNAAATSLLRIDGLGGALFAVSASAPLFIGNQVKGQVSRAAVAAGGAAGYALAMSSSALTGSAGAALDAGGSAKSLAMSDFPAMFMQGVDDEGKLRNYYMQISGGLLQFQEGA